MTYKPTLGNVNKRRSQIVSKNTIGRNLLPWQKLFTPTKASNSWDIKCGRPQIEETFKYQFPFTLTVKVAEQLGRKTNRQLSPYNCVKSRAKTRPLV